jgi:hypothetical protein
MDLSKKHPELTAMIDYYNRCDPDHPDKTYDYLLEGCKKVINKIIINDNRNKVKQTIAAGNVVTKPLGKANGLLAAGGPVQEAPVADKSRGSQNSGTPGVEKNKNNFDKTDAITRKLCFAFQKGECPNAAGDCNFTHELAKQARPRTRSPPKGGPRLPKSQVPCMWFPKGTCRAGDSCEYSHGGATAATAAGIEKEK